MCTIPRICSKDLGIYRKATSGWEPAVRPAALWARREQLQPEVGIEHIWILPQIEKSKVLTEGQAKQRRPEWLEKMHFCSWDYMEDIFL